MEGRRSSANYWPGFVDALSNMVLAMIFVVLVLALAMGMYSTLAAEALSKRYQAEATAAEALAAPRVPAPQVDAAAAQQPGKPPPGELQPTARLRVRSPEKPASAAATLTTVRRQLNALIIEFDSQAVALDERTTRSLTQALGAAEDLLRTGSVEIVASAPAGFLTEGQQISFFRAMAVRNYLLERGMNADRITVRVLDEASGAEMGEVRLTFRATRNATAP